MGGVIVRVPVQKALDVGYGAWEQGRRVDQRQEAPRALVQDVADLEPDLGLREGSMLLLLLLRCRGRRRGWLVGAAFSATDNG